MNIAKTRILGDTLLLREWKPSASDQNSEAVILLHGIESHSEWFSELAENLTQHGYSVLAYDRAGWGMSKGIHGHIPSYNHILKQLTTIATSLRGSHTRVHLVGLSWGGMFALYAALRRRIFFDSLSMIAPGIYPNNTLPATTLLSITTAIIGNQLLKSFTLPLNLNDFTRDPEKYEYITGDPLRNRSVTAGTAFETMKMQEFCKATTRRRQLLPTTLLLGSEDKIIKNSLTRELFSSQNITIKEYSGKLHSLIFEAPEQTTQDLISNFENSTEKPAGRQRILIMGAGAVGSIVGGYLSLGGNEVTLVGRKKHVDTINSAGLTIKLGGVERRNIRKHLSAVEDIRELEGSFDLIIISVKSFDTPAALQELSSIITPATTLLSLQNGIGNEPLIHQTYPENTLLAGIICMNLNFSSPGHIECSDDKGGIAIGLYHGSSEATQNAITALRASGLQVDYSEPDSTRIKWSKMLLNISSNVLNAITGKSYKEILADKFYGNLAIDALKETFAIMKHEGIAPIKLPGYNVEALAKLCKAPNFVARQVLRRVADDSENTVTSMQQDLNKLKDALRNTGKSKNTEIQELNGKIVELGKKYGIATPVNEKLCQMLKAHSEL